MSTIAGTTFFCKDAHMSDPAPTAARESTVGRSPGAPAAIQTTPHGEAWRALTRTQAGVGLRLQATLAESGFPPLPWYEVLETIAEAPEERMRMGDLAETLVITRGGLTKLVDRLVKSGLVERTVCEADRRVSYATLCPDGRRLLAEMRPVLIAELEAAFSAQLSVRQAEQLRDTLERVRGSACGRG
jgi:DNA-binding MarR family transcriptional regulator